MVTSTVFARAVNNSVVFVFLRFSWSSSRVLSVLNVMLGYPMVPMVTWYVTMSVCQSVAAVQTP